MPHLERDILKFIQTNLLHSNIIDICSYICNDCLFKLVINMAMLNRFAVAEVKLTKFCYYYIF